MEKYEFRPYHGSGGFFGRREECLAELDAVGCGDVYGPDDGEHLTLRCSSCEDLLASWRGAEETSS